MGLALPLPVLSINFFRSVLKYSNTCVAIDHLESIGTNIIQARHCKFGNVSHQVQAGLVVLLYVLNT